MKLIFLIPIPTLFRTVEDFFVRELVLAYIITRDESSSSSLDIMLELVIYISEIDSLETITVGRIGHKRYKR